MNKLAMVLGVTAVVTLAGCKDPDYGRDGSGSQNEVKQAGADMTAVTVDVAPAKTCQCLPGTKHTAPCACGASDCTCKVEPSKVIVTTVDTAAKGDGVTSAAGKAASGAAVATAAGAATTTAATTTYIVQNGDYLAKISKKFNIRQRAILAVNPGLNPDKIRIGQRIQLPGQVDVGEQKDPVKVAAAAKADSAAKASAPYTGATKEYVVKSGDTLGALAYGSGINVRQLKALNGLTSDRLKIGQKLKVPAEKVVKATAPAAKAVAAPAALPVAEKPAAEVAAEAKVGEVQAAPAADAAVAADPAPVAAAVPAKAAGSAMTYVVQEGDDMTGVAIRWGVSAAEIRELNGLADGDQLVPGQVIKLPAEAQQ